MGWLQRPLCKLRPASAERTEPNSQKLRNQFTLRNAACKLKSRTEDRLSNTFGLLFKALEYLRIHTLSKHEYQIIHSNPCQVNSNKLLLYRWFNFSVKLVTNESVDQAKPDSAVSFSKSNSIWAQL